MRFIMAGFGVLWTVLAIGLTASAPSDGPFLVAKFVFPGFGVLFTIAAFVSGGFFDSVFKSILRQQRKVGDGGAHPRRAPGLKCPSCGAGVSDGSKVSPHGDARCEHCGQWFNING